MIAQHHLLVEYQTRYCSERDLSLTTEKFFRYGVRSFERWAQHAVTLHFAAQHLNEYLAYLSGSRNRYTAGSYRSSIVALLRAAAAEGLCQLPPKIRPIRRPEHRPHGWTPEEIARLMRHASPLQRAAIRLGYDTGLRKSDLFAVRWPQVIGRRGDWRVVHTAAKTGRQVVRRIRNETYDELDALRNPNDDRLLPADTKYTGWRKRWHRLGREAGVETRRRGLQALRRTGATLAKRAGANPSEYLGHSPRSGDLASRYYLDPELLDDAPPLPPEVA